MTPTVRFEVELKLADGESLASAYQFTRSRICSLESVCGAARAQVGHIWNFRVGSIESAEAEGYFVPYFAATIEIDRHIWTELRPKLVAGSVQLFVDGYQVLGPIA